MSGKAPPKGPRALLASMPGGGVQASQSQASPPQGPASSRIGATPPTGPRSLMNGQFRGGFGGGIGPKGKPFINGYGHGHPPHQPHPGHVHGHARGHPLKPPVNGAGPGPSTLKQQQQATQNGGPGPNTLKQQQQNQQQQQQPDSTQNGLIAPGGARAAISISMAPVKIQQKSTPLGPKAQISPPQPVSEPPPPPPPPSGSPPPMPPSSLPPPPPPPASAPPPPPTNAPPPPPVPEASPPPPPPPSNSPPPPPPPSDKAAPPPPPDQPPPPLPSIFTTTPDPSAPAAPAPISIALPTPIRAPAGPPPVQLHVAQNAQSSSSSTPTLPVTKTFFQPPPSPPLPGSSSSSSRDRDRERERERERSDSRAGYSNNRVSSSSSRPRSPTYSSRARSPSQSYTRQRSPSSRRSVSPLPAPIEPPAPPPRPKTPPKWDLPVWPPSRVPCTSESSEASSSSSLSLPIPSTSGSKIPPSQYSYSPSNPRSHKIIFDPALPDGRDPKFETLKVREWKENTWKSYVRGGTSEGVDEGAVISRPREMDYFDLLMFAIRRVKGKEKAVEVEEDVEMGEAEVEVEPSDPSSSTPRRPTAAELAYIRSERQKEHRVHGKGKGKESVVRYDGEVLDEGTWTWISEAEFRSSSDDTVGAESTPDKGWWIREHQPVPDDPRKRIPDKERERKVKTQFYELKYEYDPQTSTGPAPPTCVLITNVAPLTSNTSLRQHFNTHGTILSFEPQIDKENGSPLGVLYLRYATHEEAKRCVERENGKKRPFGGSKGAGEGEEICAAFDGEGHKLKAVIRELDERKKEKRRRDRGEVSKDKISTPTTSSSSARPFHPLPLKPGAKPATPGPPVTTTTASGNATPRAPHVSTPVQPAPTSIPPPKLNGIGPASLPAKPVTAPAPPPHALPTTSATFTAERMSASGSTLAEKSRGIVSEEEAKPGIGRLPPMLARARNDHRMQEEERNRKIQKDLEQKKVEEGVVSVPEKDRERDKENDRGRERRERDHETLMGAPMSSTRDRRDRGRDSDRYYKRGRRDSRSASRDRYRARSPRRHVRPHRRWSRSRSFSPLRSRSGTPPPIFMRQQKWDMDHQEVLQELARSNVDHVHIYPTDSSDVEHWAKMVRKEEVENRFRNLEPDKIMKSSKGVFISFRQSAHASRVANVSRIDQPTFAGIQVAVISRPPPGKDEIAAAEKRPGQAEEELIDKAQKMIIDELKKQLHKDVLDKVVGVEMRKMIQRENAKGAGKEGGAWSSVALTFGHKSLSGLSFKKQRKAKEVVPAVVEVEDEDIREAEAEEEDDRPKKKRKTEKTKTVKRQTTILDEEDEVELESEDETLAPVDDVATKKRTLSVEPESEDEEPVRKKPKTDEIKVPKKGAKKTDVEEVDDVILPDELFDIPSVDQVRITPSFDPSLSPSRSASPARSIPRLETPPPSPPPDFGVCDDDEDEYFAKLVLLGKGLPSTDSDAPLTPPEPDEPSSPALRKHTTGSARTEGFYKITHAEKAAYVSQYQARNTTNVAVKEAAEDTQPQHVTSSRSNRANARRRAQGLEEINQVQRAVALSKGETANELTFKFNQLQTRKKHLRFARSPIHDWGLYAMERISRGEMVIEYVGEVIRAQVADKREKTYERQGIGSSYLFRIDEDLVVDATKKGNLGGEKKIVIYAKQDIELGDEITYDYHFPFEQDKIPCLCGSAKCRGFLN
ncbi:histone methyltransferase set1 [Paramarasmius palmivorus]|uniref:Histone-lysine N-methyltransferase, H3 lysine-4 specific n=1 Tax=Paramarasmius palmivorus TaxID=297713 RepID=A0AAW0DDR0_9AGAR